MELKAYVRNLTYACSKKPQPSFVQPFDDRNKLARSVGGYIQILNVNWKRLCSSLPTKSSNSSLFAAAYSSLYPYCCALPVAP